MIGRQQHEPFAPAPSELPGIMHINVVEARDLRLPPGWFNSSADTATKRGRLLNLEIQPLDAVLLPAELGEYLGSCGLPYTYSKEKLDEREGVWHVIEADPEASRQETSWPTAMCFLLYLQSFKPNMSVSNS